MQKMYQCVKPTGSVNNMPTIFATTVVIHKKKAYKNLSFAIG